MEEEIESAQEMGTDSVVEDDEASSQQTETKRVKLDVDLSQEGSQMGRDCDRNASS